MIAGLGIGWLGLYIYFRALKSGAGDEQAETLVGRFVRLFERGLDALSARPARYAIGFFLVLASVYSTYSGNISVFGFPVEQKYWILGYFIWSVLWRVDSRGAIAIAIGILVTCPFLIVMEQPTLAEQAAVSVFYFLVIGVIEQIVEYIREERAKSRMEAPAAEVVEEADLGEVRDVVKEPEDVEEALARFEEEGARAGAARKRRPQRRAKPLVLSFVVVVALVAVIGVAYVLIAKPGGVGLRASTGFAPTDFTIQRAILVKLHADQIQSSLLTNPSIIVLNGSGKDGEATRIGEVLKDAGRNVVGVETAASTSAVTTIHYKPEYLDTAEEIADDISGLYPAKLEEGAYAGYDANIVIVLGTDAKSP
ncbi:MAG: LytR C-terminal domain-containing protein [Actinomycetota bacterium]